MTAETHFVQAGDAPVLIGAGNGTLVCACGVTLIRGYDPAQFLAIGLRCSGCGTVTATPGLPAGGRLPRSAIIAAPSAEPRETAMTVPGDVRVVGQAEMRRLRALFLPVTPADSLYSMSAALLDAVEAAFARHTGGPLPDAGSDEALAGMRAHALGWAVRHLRTRLRSESWACLEDAATGTAVTLVTGFLHFVATWAHHPSFPAMVATAGDRGFSLHGLAPFAAAHCLTMAGNAIRFSESSGYPARIEGLSLVPGATEDLPVHIETFDRFDFPFSPAWDARSVRAAVSAAIGAAQARINPRRPGLLLLVPGMTMSGCDPAMVEAVKALVPNLGRKNRGLMAVVPLLLRPQALPDPHAIRFCYNFIPFENRHYRGEQASGLGG